jgi:PhnB protein
MAVKPIPEGYHTLTPACAIVGCDKAVELYRKVFDAQLHLRMDYPNGKVAHCELRFGDSIAMMGEAEASMGVNPYNMHLMVYVTDCDAVFKRATDAGFTAKEQPKNQFYGDRSARVTDPFGNEWFIATHVEDVPEEEMKRRMAKMMGGS